MIKANGIITLLTDFGERDGFVGTMKGVILGINPKAKIIDISHQTPAQDIESAAFILYNSYKFFPKGTVHVAVVDPGVGSLRKIILVEANDQYFLVPDNAILKYIFNKNETFTVFEVLNSKYFLKSISRTFHGRDIFAPVAAHLSRGILPKNFGPEINTVNRGKISEPVFSKNAITGKIIYVDHFGNLITNIKPEHLPKNNWYINLKGIQINRLSEAYADVDDGEILAIIGSHGYIEISCKNSSAAEKLAINRNEVIIVQKIP